MLQERHSLSPVTTLGGSRLSVRVASDLDRFVLRGDPALSSQLESALDWKLAGRIGEATTKDARTSVRVGPDEWFLLAAPGTVSNPESRLQEAMPDQAWSMVDVSHREVGIELSGEAAALALSSFIAFDVGAMAVGDGCRTLFDKAQVILIREAPERFRIEVWQSFASHVWLLLEAASREIARDI